MNDFIQPISEEFNSIFFVKGQNRGRYPYSHSLLINDCLFDTGISSGFMRKLKRTHAINNILLSHWHEDHISGNRLLPNAQFYAHNNDKPVIEDINLMNGYYLVEDNMEQIELYTTILEGLRLQNTRIDNLIEDDMQINMGNGLKTKVIHTPGHTEGHCSFLEINSRVAFLADIDLSSFGPWYAGKDSSVIEFEDSIDKLMRFDIDIAVTSHKGIITGKSKIRESLKNFKRIIYDRDERILENLSEKTPKTAKDLRNLNIIYTYYTEYKTYELFAEEIMINYHFEKFFKQDLIQPKDMGYILS